MKIAALILSLALAVPALAPVARAQDDGQDFASSGTGAEIRALDKVNGRTVDIEVPTGRAARVFGLVVEMAECRYPADNPTGDAYAFLVVREDNSRDALFAGWMIASSPALNALDHSRYDVWVLRCMTS